MVAHTTLLEISCRVSIMCLTGMLIFFSKQLFQMKHSSIRASNGLDPEQARCFDGPDLGPNSLQKLSVDDTWRHS